MIRKNVVYTGLLSLVLGLSACGGGSSGSSTVADTSGSANVSTLKITDTVVGTGAMAGAGNTVTVNYTGWLYNEKASDLHGSQFDSSVGRQPFSFFLGAGRVIKGWDQGLIGMRVGGKRTLIIPSALGRVDMCFGCANGSERAQG